MLIEIEGLKIHYKVSGQGMDLVLLHGWGASIATMQPVHNHFERYFRTVSLDLPGFGASQPPPIPWGVEDYERVVGKFLDELQISQPVIMGHSYGGKIAICLAARGRAIKKMVLIDSAGIRARRGFKHYSRVYAYKAMRRIFNLPGIRTVFKETVENWKNQAGSEDYRNARGVMRQTLVKAVNEDITHLLSLVKVPALLIWGDQDTATPLSDGKTMERLIPDAGLVVLKGGGHYSYLDRLGEFLLITDTFLKNEMEKSNEQ